MEDVSSQLSVSTVIFCFVLVLFFVAKNGLSVVCHGCQWRNEHCFLLPFSFQVRDGQMETDPLIGKYCGSSLPAPILSSSNSLWIRFRSDTSVSRAGFRAVYTVGEIPHSSTHTHVIWHHACFVDALCFISEMMPVLFNNGCSYRVRVKEPIASKL